VIAEVQWRDASALAGVSAILVELMKGFPVCVAPFSILGTCNLASINGHGEPVGERPRDNNEIS